MISTGLKHGEVRLANLNPGRGAEPGKIRPVLIVQSQALLDADHSSTLIIPLTTRLINDAAPLRLRLPAQDKLNKDSDLLVDQLRAIDNVRLSGDPLATCSGAFMQHVYDAICETLDIPFRP